jgi:hypothetical protein
MELAETLLWMTLACLFREVSVVHLTTDFFMSHHEDEDSASETVYDSTSPLLEANRRKSKPTPIPKLSLAAVCLARLVDPVNFSQIFPYVNEFMSRLGVTDDEDKIGFYSGFVVRALSSVSYVSQRS